MAWVWLREWLTPWRIAGLAVGFAGVLLLAWSKVSFKPGGSGLASGRPNRHAVLCETKSAFRKAPHLIGRNVPVAGIRPAIANTRFAAGAAVCPWPWNAESGQEPTVVRIGDAVGRFITGPGRISTRDPVVESLAFRVDLDAIWADRLRSRGARSMEKVDTVVIGGGQAGLAMSYYLAQRGREHLVLERARVAERWRSEPPVPI
jgi:hypothetical protein